MCLKTFIKYILIAGPALSSYSLFNELINKTINWNIVISFSTVQYHQTFIRWNRKAL